MMEAKHINYLELEDDNKSDFTVASTDGRGFAVSGGVAKAVVNVIHDRYPDREVKVEAAEGLEECRTMMKAAIKGKLDGYLLEGMACPGGCVAGAGTLTSIQKTAAMVNMYAKRSSHAHSSDSGLDEYIPELMRKDDYINMGKLEVAEINSAMGVDTPSASPEK